MGKQKIVRLNLEVVEQSLKKVEKNWQKIDDELDRLKIGRKDTPFNSDLREKMMSAYEYLDSLLKDEVEPFSDKSFGMMLELNNLVHYGKNIKLRYGENEALQVSKEKFYKHIGVLNRWYEKHKKREDNPLKIAAEIYVGIVGYPQLFVEGNHRTGSMISSWIDMYHGEPPFILSPDNAVAYFAPSSEIKHFSDKSTWRGRWKLPKYKKSFREFWEAYTEEKYIK